MTGTPVSARYAPISDYAIIGDCHSAALVSREGSIDWLCWPRFDSPTLFGALLDAEQGGRWLVRPTAVFTSERRYLGPTIVLETRFRTSSGVVRLLDLMPVESEIERRRELRPDRAVLRLIECLDGQVEIEMRCDARPDYGRARTRPVERGPLGWRYEHPACLLTLRSEVPLGRAPDGGLEGRVTLRAGERRAAALTFADREPAVLPALGDAAWRRLESTRCWWESWAARCHYQGPYRDAVLRSALTLKLMSYAPSGAVVAAPTTSLPEWLGGVRNWDYRFCWLRDASLTVQALFDLGYPEEANAFMAWLLHTTRLTRPELQIVYDVYGGPDLPERELAHLEGYAESRPVRIGNAARNQLQLDVYGEVLDAAYHFVRRGGRLDRDTARMLVGFGNTICRRWREPDAGMWESRAALRHHTYSKAMCWVGLDRLLRLHRERHVVLPAARFEAERSAIREAIESSGYSRRLESYVAAFDGEELDASLLRLPRLGYVEATAPRMVQTADSIETHLASDGLLYRYRAYADGLPPGEGAFGICSFWAATCRALGGDVDGAAEIFERVLGFANDVGLYAEEIDPATGTALGNFPQAFTHLGLIDAALTLEGCRRARTRPGTERATMVTGRRL
jgi:GH15 family glucan-1,4-alpha-glucosidase